jgi:hypothetical protein
VKLRVALADRGEQRAALGAVGQAAGDILHVAALDDLAVGGQQRCANGELRIRGVAGLCSPLRGGEQVVVDFGQFGGHRDCLVVGEFGPVTAAR